MNTTNTHIYIDGSRMMDPNNGATGVETYSNEIIPRLCKLLPEAIILAKNNQYIPENINPTQVQIIPGTKLWSQFHLVQYLKNKHPENNYILYSPSHIIPYQIRKQGIATIHDIAWKYIPESYNWKQKAYLNWTTEYQLQDCKQVIAISRNTKKDIQTQFPSRDNIDVIYNGYTPQNNQGITLNNQIKKEKQIVFIGRIEEKKNLITLIEGFEEFSEKHPGYKLVLAGKDGHGSDSIYKRAEISSVKDQIELRGFISEEEKKTLLQTSQALYLGSKYEGFGFPLLEAWDYGLIPVCSNIPVLREIGRDDGAVYFDPSSPQSLTQAFNRAIKAPPIISHLDDFDWDKTVGEIYSFFVG